MARRALVERRPWLFASLAAAIAYYVLADSDYADPWLAGLKAVPLLSLAVYAFLRHASLDAALLTLVLGLCAVGDFGIEFDFVMGGIAFLLAHLVAIGLYLRNRRANPVGSQKLAAGALAIGTPLAAWLLSGALEVAAYAVSLGAMAGAAWISRFSRYRVGVGAILFIASDLLIFARMGAQIDPDLAAWLIWPIYYAGQFLICTGVVQVLRGEAGQQAVAAR